jgi:hypothetical protein
MSYHNKNTEGWSLIFFRTNLKHSLLPICGKFTRALLAHQIFLFWKKKLKRKFWKNLLKQKNERRYMLESNAFQIFGLSWKLYFSQCFKKSVWNPPPQNRLERVKSCILLRKFHPWTNLTALLVTIEGSRNKKGTQNFEILRTKGTLHTNSD